MAKATVGVRKLLHTLHRWIGLALFVLIVPVALSGALLVFHDELDALMNPARYATSGHATLAPSAYLASAAAALDRAVAPANVRYPRRDGDPVTVQARDVGGEGPPLRMMIVYLDPSTARVLDVVDFRASLFGFLHRFHENLTIPQYSGRAIVGWVGVGLLLLSLSGIVIWWPRNGTLVRALRWRRRPTGATNMHFSFGFWISLPLAFVSLTGIYLAFPPQARSMMSSVVPMTTQAPRNVGPPLRRPALTADRAYDIGREAIPGGRPAALFLPIASRGDSKASPTWRMQATAPAGEMQTVLIEDSSGKVRPHELLAGDRAAQWIRWLHEGSRGGLAWRIIVLLTGIFPPVLGVTGIVMWLRGRRPRTSATSPSAGALQAAE